MASFDIIQSAGMGYKLVWDEKSYLVKLAAVPCLIKVVCFTVITLLGWEENFTRQALVLLPSYFADGWFLSHMIRFIFLDQRWPFRPTGNTDNDMRVLQDRALGIMRGTLMYVVIKYLVAGLTGIIYQAGQVNVEIEQEQLGLGVLFLALTFFVFFFWAFRLLWLYIPAAINYPVRRYMLELGGYSASWNLIGVWLICFLPAFFVFGKLLAVMGATVDDQIADFGTQFSVIIIHMILDTLVAVLATAGLAFGLKKFVFRMGDTA